MRSFPRALIVTIFTLLPAAAFAQSSIAGTARDTSGAVLPGVTVEASSDALIEKSRSAVTDSAGQYRDRRPAAWRLLRSSSLSLASDRSGAKASSSRARLPRRSTATCNSAPSRKPSR